MPHQKSDSVRNKVKTFRATKLVLTVAYTEGWAEGASRLWRTSDGAAFSKINVKIYVKIVKFT